MPVGAANTAVSTSFAGYHRWPGYAVIHSVAAGPEPGSRSDVGPVRVAAGTRSESDSGYHGLVLP